MERTEERPASPRHRVALVTNGLARGGAEMQLLHLARGLLARGDEVGILAILPGVQFDDLEELSSGYRPHAIAGHQ